MAKEKEHNLMDYLKAKSWLKLADEWRSDVAKGGFLDVIRYAERVRDDMVDSEMKDSYPL